MIKQQRRHKKHVIRRKIKFQNYKNCLEATQFENKTNHLEKNKIDTNSFFVTKKSMKYS